MGGAVLAYRSAALAFRGHVAVLYCGVTGLCLPGVAEGQARATSHCSSAVSGLEEGGGVPMLLSWPTDAVCKVLLQGEFLKSFSQFHNIVGLRFLFPCWRSSGGHN